MAVKITKLDVAMGSLMNRVAAAVNAWKPKPLAKETQYSSALADYLREACPPETRVETEYRDGGTTADVWMSWKGVISNSQVFFELKRNLEKKTDYDRLVGQVVALKPGKRSVCVVLVGETSKELLGRLREHFKEELDDDEEHMRIVCVTPADK